MKNIQAILEKQRKIFITGKTKDLLYRKDCLRKMTEWIQTHEPDILLALKSDLNKAAFEAYATEIGVVLDEIKYVSKHLGSWSADIRVRTPIKHFPSKSYIRSEPYGIILIMSPWNYPFQLTLAPLVGAISAGNCAIVKPSAYSPHTSSLVSRMIGDVFDESHVAVIEGGRTENESLLSQKYDYICFTGSIAVGKVVMEAAAKTLTPITLELGGKSPCIVDESAPIALAARRIAWGKFINAGQTCIAPDYVLVHRSVKQALIDGIIKAIKSFYGANPCENEDYARIINNKHFNRLLDLMNGGKILSGGESDPDTLRIAPTLIDQVKWSSPVMQEEIFGPLLPILEFDTLDEAISQINDHPKPLALYLFTRTKNHEDTVLSSISFGGGCVNDTVVHLATPYMPFGGVGESGIGCYHGKAGFETFSHKKSILKKSLLLDIPLRYPPYKSKDLNMLKKL